MNTCVSLEVPAGTGRAVRAQAGELVRIVDIEGGQVGDVFALADSDATEYLSAAHTRTSTGRLFPHLGEQFVTNRRRPILTLAADSSPGVHDMLIAACDPARYRAYGVTEHRSCAANLHEALAGIGVQIDIVPQPVNVFMNIPVDHQGGLAWLPATSRPGDAITFEAAMDCIVVLSACPMDINAINGQRPTPLAIETLVSNATVNKEIRS